MQGRVFACTCHCSTYAPQCDACTPGTTATFGTNKQPSGLVSANDDYEAYVKAGGPKIIETPTPTPTTTDKPAETPTTNPH